MSGESSLASTSISHDDIVRWEQEARALDAMADGLETAAAAKRREAAGFRYRAAKTQELFDLISGKVAPPIADAKPAPVAEPAGQSPIKPGQRALRAGSWPEAIRDWVVPAPLGLTIQELKDKAAATPEWSARLEESDKGFYHALSRLPAAKILVRQGDRLFSPRAFEDYRRKMETGEITEPLQDRSPRPPSPYGQAALQIITDSPGLQTKEVVARLRDHPAFGPAIRSSPNTGFNVVAALEKKGLIVRKDSLCYPNGKSPRGQPELPMAGQVVSIGSARGATM